MYHLHHVYVSYWRGVSNINALFTNKLWKFVVKFWHSTAVTNIVYSSKIEPYPTAQGGQPENAAVSREQETEFSEADVAVWLVC